MSNLSKLKWHCRRGMKELDIVFTRYLDNAYPSASTEEKALFEAILDWQDMEIYNYLLERATPTDHQVVNFFNKLRQFSI
ncbi:succinate dehydrogenase assembly factor 2 [Beggiatoa leptomitoformis]|uniref:FAD assembly factor SdhE n=1 Tax=Beggiatoa leptomitoformis TaxID=288004 RepID=A0A2N9YA12_9GAMM|nr:succinate dehydrogenase assembly factor 2 [Beggiatoa leptomitoformis]ALG67283.1 hypothetical protein AL038_05660 [Beggiatoa leptomitoformis]AUI67289.1 hypothetical protein BLE401_00315 [Beggiatoa leptomitoformis]